MTVLRVLLTNVTLATRTGTEFFVRDLAHGLRQAGHEPVVYSPDPGSVAREIADLGIEMVESLDRLSRPPQVIHGHHTLPTLEALLEFPDVPAIYVVHDRTALHDTPLVHPRVLCHVAVDEHCRERLTGDAGVAFDDTEVIANAIDIERFTRRSPLPSRPRRALLMSNYATEDGALRAVRQACARSGVDLDAVGARLGGATPRVEEILPGYDLVFGKARCALEAMAVGCAVVVCDQAGLGGLVLPDNWARMRRFNFGAATLTEPLTSERLEREIQRYDAEASARVTDRTRDEAHLTAQVERFVSLYQRVLARSKAAVPRGDESACAARAVRSLFPAWSAVAELTHDRDEARRRAAGVERELDELRSTAAFRLRQLLLRGSPGIRGLGVRLGRWLPGLRRA
jgi:glycosyltransferase involved in cell wall biosynthesis